MKDLRLKIHCQGLEPALAQKHFPRDRHIARFINRQQRPERNGGQEQGEDNEREPQIFGYGRKIH